MADNTQLQLALEEMRRSYDQFSTSADQLDAKAGTLLSSSSLILGLFALLQLTLAREGQSCLYWVGLSAVISGYVGLVYLCSSVLIPRQYLFPTPADWDILSASILKGTAKAAYSTVISSYVERIPHNRQINDTKARRVRLASWLLSAIVVLIVLLSLVPR